jgi:DNA-binding transcriptional LysR family regulator
MRFDFFDLKLFVAVAEAGNLTQASNKLHIAPAGASSRIRNFEEALGSQLFYRGSTGLRLTPAGAAAVPYARRLLALGNRMCDDVAQYGAGRKGHVRLHSISVAATEYLPSELSRFLLSHPHVNVVLEERMTDEILRALREEAADIGIIGGDPGSHELEVFPYVTERMVVITPASHPLSQRDAVDFEEAIGYEFVGVSESNTLHFFLARLGDQLGKSFRTRTMVRSLYEVSHLVEAGVGISIIEEAAARRFAGTMKICIVALTDAWSLREIKICVRDLSALPLFAQELVAQLRAQGAYAIPEAALVGR